MVPSISPFLARLVDFLQQPLTMQDTPGNKATVDAEIELSHSEHRDVPTGYSEDPHKAALEDNPEHAEKLWLVHVFDMILPTYP